MQTFTTLTAVAAPLNMINVDTDMILPKQYMKTIVRTGLGRALFSELRYNQAHEENPSFVLNQAPYRNAKILVTGRNFGCGSSREHAAWALKDFGIRCVIAPEFADIFFNNAFKNSMLPVVLSEPRVNELMRFLLELPGAEITVDLETQTVVGPDGTVDNFSTSAFSRQCLLEGLDEIDITNLKRDKIEAFEQWMNRERPWL